MSTATLADLRRDLDLASGPVTHIVRRRSEARTVVAEVLEARVNGTPLEALCGHVWVPSRDPQRLPLCWRCREIFEMNGEWGVGPRVDPTGLQSA